jgi:hypothetical protein
MRFMVMHKMTEEMDRSLRPDPAIIAAVGALVEEGVKDKVFVSGEGLMPSSERVRIAYKGGTRTVTAGPFVEGKELIRGFALLRVRSKEEAMSWCDKFATAMGDVELCLGPVVEFWDLGLAPKPKHPPLRFLALYQADERSEHDLPADPQVTAKMGALIEEATAAGLLQGSGALASTKKGARLRFERGKHTVMDGPFTESKELIAGYAILNLPSKAAAIEWARRFGEIVKVNEVDVREMQTP